MARPSKKAERTEEILKAFRHCVAHYGLEASTLERVAEVSGLQRSLVRHYVGNRDDLVQQLAERVIEESNHQWQEFIKLLPEKNTTQYFIEYLFSEYDSDPDYVLVMASLIFAAGRNSPLQNLMRDWIQNYTNEYVGLLRGDYPDASDKQLEAVAFGLVSLYFNLDSLSPLNLGTDYRESAKEAALRLVSTL